MGNSSGTRNQQPQPEFQTTSTSVNDRLRVSDPNAECSGQEQVNDREPRPEDHVPASSRSAAHADENEIIVVTSVRAKDVALGLRRIPAGFYTVVQHSGREWRTENKRSSMSIDVIEWSGPIPIPTDPSATVGLRVYASFEFHPMLGSGELLRELTVTVEQLLDCGRNDIPFTFLAKDDDVVPTCSSLLVMVGRRRPQRNDPSAPRVLDAHCLTSGRLENVTDKGHSALSRYRKHGEKRDLDHSIEQFQRALNICPLNDPCRAAALANLAMAKFILYQLDDLQVFLDAPIALYSRALAARPIGHPDRPSTLIQLATVHVARFEKRRDEADAAKADALLCEAMNLSPADSHENRAAIYVLALHAGRDIIDMTAHGHHDNACRLHSLGKRFFTRFHRLKQLSDLEQAISRFHDAVDLTPHNHPHKHTLLVSLCNSFIARFNRLGELGDLEQVISRRSDIVDLTPAGHPDKPCRLHNLGNSFLTRFHRLGEVSDLEQAILRLSDAAILTPHGHPHRLGHLKDLGDALKTRFTRLGELSDLERFRDIVDLTPDGNSHKPCQVNNLGKCFLTRFNRLGDLNDLEQAISRFSVAADLTPHGHPHKHGHLKDLGDAFKARFERLGETSDLEQAVSRFKDAVDLIPDGRPTKPYHLISLGSAHSDRFHRLGELSDLEQAISRFMDAVRLTPHGHPHELSHLTMLGNSFRARFLRLGDLSDLDQAMSRFGNVVDLTPDGHPEKPCRLHNLGLSFLTRFQRLGELSDLEQAISMLSDAVDLTPDDHPHKPCHLQDLGGSFNVRFERLGELSDLEEAISRVNDALNLTPDDHPHKPRHLNSLGNTLLARLERFGELGDLEHAMSRLQDAVDLTPDGHPAKHSYLNDLGNAFAYRFLRHKQLSDLEKMISSHSDAIDITPDNDPGKSCMLNSLGLSFLTRFRHLGGLHDLEKSILRFKDAVNLTSGDHPHKPRHLSSLGSSFKARFWCLKQLGDLEKTISLMREALDLIPDDHPTKPNLLNNLADAFRTRFHHLAELSDLLQAISLYSSAACASAGPTTIRFHAAQEWISCALLSGHHSLLSAYSSAISLLPQLAWIGLPLTQRYQELTRGADVVREAAAAALDSGLPEIAVEWLEQGRSIVWGELFQLRSSYEELSSVYPDHARRLQQLSATLEHSSATHERCRSSQTWGLEHRATESLEQAANKHRALAIERGKLLQEIRRLPGFERFLLYKEFSHLRASSRSGPVVILNAAKNRCDALIVLADVENVIHVPLPNITLERSKGLQNTLKSLLGPARILDEREGKREPRKHVNWESVLSTLWHGVVKPVLDALAFSSPMDLSRIFWCPTGPFTFLPIHAAGLYGIQYSEPGHKVSDFVISSYVPTLSILGSLTEIHAASGRDLRFLTIRQPPSDGLPQLPGVDAELENIRAIIGDSPSVRTTLLESSIGTVEEALDLMKEADWVHFACHGIQDLARPTDSGLCLADGRRLKVSDIMALSRPRGGLAFLSACQTAMGDEALSDEAIHIAAGMVFSGYGGVIGTMWSISDRLAPHVTIDVYEHIFRNDTGPDYREAARALQIAVGRLRESGASFAEWLPFIHVGL